jgi:hypothetical protein
MSLSEARKTNPQLEAFARLVPDLGALTNEQRTAVAKTLGVHPAGLDMVHRYATSVSPPPAPPAPAPLTDSQQQSALFAAAADKMRAQEAAWFKSLGGVPQND